MVEFEKSQSIYIEGKIESKLLSSESCYAAYLVFGFAEMYANLNSAVSIVRNFYNEPGQHSVHYKFLFVKIYILHCDIGVFEIRYRVSRGASQDGEVSRRK